jgi:hypothetical protein
MLQKQEINVRNLLRENSKIFAIVAGNIIKRWLDA